LTIQPSGVMHDVSSWIEGTQLSKALFDIAWLWPLCESLHFLYCGRMLPHLGTGN
jgi:hypothetical protein